MPKRAASSETADGSRKLEKTFDPASFEERWYALWEAEGRFQPEGPASSPRYVMVIPPPNVTGRLHVGHALGRTLEDVLARWRRMQGHRVLWVPGTDHAGIATQMVVERELARQGIDRRQLGREAFLERVWAWKSEAGGAILQQLRRLGCSLDWTRLRFTLDPELSRAVRRAFVQLYREGLVHRGRAVVNWCPRCGTAVSDLEVVKEEVNGKLYKIRYDVPGVPSGAVVATTRPETMLGDTAIAIHPEDPRTAKLRGRKAVLPLVGRELPIIEDPILVDRAFGTGIVKVTPAHDANDFASGQRHDLPAIVVIGPDGRMTPEAGAPYAGLDRFEARQKVLERLTAENRLVATEDHRYALGRCQRCNTVIEPYLSTQWFVRVGPLAEPAIRAVRDGAVRFFPESWTKTYFAWMENIHDWTISRQLWWGHRIPAFYCDNGHMTVSEEDPSACPECGSSRIEQDPDVLDTWFSSQLWPFSVFGWPEKTRDLEQFYPTDVLVTGYDIIFFWVARMIMAGIHFTGQPPFSKVHLHGLVRVGGEKMSKTKGNVIDPLEAIEEYGADAVRFALASAPSSGPTVSLEKHRLADSRAFATKIWNASRLALGAIAGGVAEGDPKRTALELPDRWILSRLSAAAREVSRQLELFRFDEASQAIYSFVWHELCDGYIEMIKPRLSAAGGVAEASREAARETLARCLADSLALLHPFMPFVTEEIWEKLSGRPGTLVVAAFPSERPEWSDPGAERSLEALRALVTRVRNFRAERGTSPTEPVELWVDPDSADPQTMSDLKGLSPLLSHLARLSALRFEAPPGEGAARDVVAGVSVGLALPRPSSAADRSRVEKALSEVNREIETLAAKLRNPSFLDRAPAPVVEKTRRRLVELEQRRSALSGA